MDIINKVRDTIKRHSLIQPSARVIVGVSGGPDSVALIHILNNLKKVLGIELHIAHLDHALRANSQKDAIFVRKLAKSLSVPFTCRRVEVKNIPGRLSIEEKARNARLDFFLGLASKLKADRIALAHNFDDQAETVLMRILRGTGLYGLSGMLPKRKMGDIFIIRPLLMVKRREIESFLNRKRIKFCVDETNLSRIYFRNKIRHSLIPYLEKGYNKNIKETLFNLGLSAGSDYEYLKNSASRFLAGNKTRLNLKNLIRLHPSVLRFKLRQGIAALQGDTRRITFKHIQELEDLIFNRPPGSIVDLPKGLSIKKDKKTLFFYLR